MQIIELFLLAVGLSMDAFAVAICKGLGMRKFHAGRAAVVGLWFGGFQALMPLIGYYIGSRFIHKIEKYDHWIAFFLLFILGANMLREAVKGSREEKNCGCPDGGCGCQAGLGFVSMLMLALATSIDALVVGLTFAVLRVSIFFSVSIIGAVTFLISVIGVGIGASVGERYKNKAEYLGGCILIAIGVRILVTGLL